MKACILGNTALGYSWFVLTYRQGLRMNGVEVYEIDYKSNPINDIKKMLMKMKADIVFTHLTFHNIYSIPAVLQMFRDINKTVGTKFIHVTMDARGKDRYMADISGVFHLAVVGNHIMEESGRSAWNIPTMYSPYASMYYDKMSEPVNELVFTDALFTGNSRSHPDRTDFINKLSKRIPLKIITTQSGQDLRHRTHELSASAKCILGLCTGYDIDGYIDVRPFQYLGAGACMIIRKFKNMDRVIPEHLYFPIDSYSEKAADECAEYYRRSLKEDTLEMRKEAFDFMQNYHSSKIRIKEILNKIGE